MRPFSAIKKVGFSTENSRAQSREQQNYPPPAYASKTKNLIIAQARAHINAYANVKGSNEGKLNQDLLSSPGSAHQTNLKNNKMNVKSPSQTQNTQESDELTETQLFLVQQNNKLEFEVA